MTRLVFSGSLSQDRIDVLTPFARDLLVRAAEKAGIERLIITSTIRQPRVQAEAMYHNIASGRLMRYKSAGQKVTELCVKMLGRKESREATIVAMQNLIEELSEQGLRVSRHCVSEEEYAKCNIVDVSRSLLYGEAQKFIKALSEAESVVKIIQPIGGKIEYDKVSFDPNEAAIHIEINIPQEHRL